MGSDSERGAWIEGRGEGGEAVLRSKECYDNRFGVETNEMRCMC